MVWGRLMVNSMSSIMDLNYCRSGDVVGKPVNKSIGMALQEKRVYNNKASTLKQHLP